jgi:hypothetical protein
MININFYILPIENKQATDKEYHISIYSVFLGTSGQEQLL